MDFTDYDTRLAAYALIVDEAGRILLTWFVGSPHAEACWSMPGGGVEFDESAEEAVAREVHEETGYTVEVGRPLAVHHFTRPHSNRTDRPYKSVRLLFTATITGGTLGTTEHNGSTAFARWIPLAEVPTLTPRADLIDVALTKRPSP